MVPSIKTLWFQVHFYDDEFTAVYDEVPQDMLPSEYGGLAGSMQQMNGIPYSVLSFCLTFSFYFLEKVTIRNTHFLKEITLLNRKKLGYVEM